MGRTFFRPPLQPRPIPRLTLEDEEGRRLQFTVQEYIQIKQENLVCIQSMQGTLQFGFTALSILVASVTQIWRDDVYVSAVVLLFVAPVVCLLITRVWAAEVVRLGRASYFLWQLEIELNHYFSAMASAAPKASGQTALNMIDTLHWEGWVRGGNRWGRNILMKRNYRSILGFLIGLSCVSAASGLARLVVVPEPNWYVIAGAGVWVLILAINSLLEARLTWRNIVQYAAGPTP
jgi:hypothetical protein